MPPAGYGLKCDSEAAVLEAVLLRRCGHLRASRLVHLAVHRVLPDGYEVNALFAPERSPSTTGFLALGRHLLDASFAEILAAARVADGIARHSTEPGGRTTAEVVAHVAQAERWYLSRHAAADAPVPQVDPADGPAAFAEAHSALAEWLADAEPAELRRIVVCHGKSWSVRKLVRRALWHRLTHLAELTRRTT